MTKQEWIEAKATTQIPMEAFYEFYTIQNEKDTIMSAEEFRNNFQVYVYHLGRIPTMKMIEYFDQKLGITKLFDKLGKLIKEF